MASFDLNVEKNVGDKNKRTKGWGIFLVVFSAILLLMLVFDFVPIVSSVVLGAIGLFAYPLCIVLFCVGLALLTDKHYFLPKRYLVYLSVTVFCVLGIVNIIILGNPEGGYLDYLEHCYEAKLTAGGVVVGLVSGLLVKTLGTAAGIIIFGLILCVFVGLMIDFLNSIKKYGVKKVTAKKDKNFKVIEVEKPVKKEKPAQKPQEEVVEASKEFNLFLDKKLEEQENRNALLKLGLIEGNIEPLKAPNEKKSIREHLLTPPKLEETYFGRNLSSAKKAQEIENNINLLKNMEAPPEEEEFTDFDEFDTAEIFDEDFMEDDEIGEFVEETKVYQPPQKEATNPFKSQTQQVFVQKMGPMFQDKPKYVFPPITLLENHEKNSPNVTEDVIGKRALLEETLATFGIKAKVRGVVIGPSVTRYEIEMPHGVSVKRILSLEDDISLALASRAGIRIEAPIPGKSAVGIEVPNESISTVSLREVLETDDFKQNRSPVTFALGRNISGEAELCNLAKMPHILVAGATNSGKSICLNAIIISMIYKSSPEDLRLILIDPKRVEFSLYNDLPHLLIPNVITEVDKAVNALLWCVNEMERRFELLALARCRNSEEYNHSRDVKNGDAPKMPYIVVIVDELADLMSSGKKELEEYLRRLTQKARAAGILLVLATQRPSVDVITGVIKTNCPARISFALTSQVDSRTILDTAGAESLLGRGDMLYRPSDAPSPRRVQGCFVSAEEVERVVDFIKENSSSTFDEKAQEAIDKPVVMHSQGQYEAVVGDPKWDPLLPQALKMFIENGQASTSAIQRRFLAGFPRASRIVDQLCQMGYLSEPVGTKPRTVLITMEEFYEKFGRDFE